jgi:beta-glucosidase
MVLACGSDSSTPDGVPPRNEIEERVRRVLGEMTLEEKIEQMHGTQALPIDGLYYTPDNARLGVPGFRMVDGPRGVRAGNATTFPVGMARGASWDRDLERRIGEAMGKETAAKGGNVLLAPCINLLRHPSWGRAQETYGEDSHHLGEMGAAFVEGAQRWVLASAKHFAANSIEDTRFTVNVTLDARTLREVYLPHFEKVVKSARVASVMTAYNKVNGAYSAENAPLVHDILKGEWDFDGFVESDWVLGTRSTVPSALAGLDIEMPNAGFYGPPLLDAVNAGEVPVSAIDDSVRRILRKKFEFGLDAPEVPPAAVVESAEHTALALEAARKSIVLLKNEGNALPLEAGRIGRLAVVGRLADTVNLGDRGSSNSTPSYAITPRAGIERYASPAGTAYIAGPELTQDDALAISDAGAAVVVVGLTGDDEGEGFIAAGDRESLDLRAEDIALIGRVAELNARTIVVVEGGSAITMQPWIDQVEAVLFAWYPGMEGGNALAEIVFGLENPSAKLPISFPRSADQLPAFVNDSDEVTYDYFHGYYFLDKNGHEPEFPFGYGLSYTAFDYGSLSVESPRVQSDGTVRASIEVSNTGGRTGTEIVQLYVAAASSIERPPRKLASFARVSLNHGETQRVTLQFPAKDLAYWDEALNGWVIEPISYTLAAGASSRDLPATATFQVVD